VLPKFLDDILDGNGDAHGINTIDNSRRARQSGRAGGNRKRRRALAEADHAQPAGLTRRDHAQRQAPASAVRIQPKITLKGGGIGFFDCGQDQSNDIFGTACRRQKTHARPQAGLRSIGDQHSVR
jgi:hypothetical protein